MYLIQKDKKLFVRDVVGSVAYYWPVTNTLESFSPSRLKQFLEREAVYDSFPNFITSDGIVLSVPDGSETQPAWTESLKEQQSC